MPARLAPREGAEMTHPGGRFRRGLLYSAAAGIFGGAMWFLMLLVAVPAAEWFSAPWWTVGAAGTAVWLAAGFVTGRFGPDARPRGEAPGSGTRLSRAAEAGGRFLYRLVVGSLVGFIAAVGSGLAAGLLVALGADVEKVRGTPPFAVVLSAIGGCVC